MKTETILEDWCFRFYLDYIFLYNKTEEKYYGKYKIITKNNQPLLSLSPEQAYGIINIYESKDLSDNILDIEDENYVFFWEKENMQCKKKDILTEENIYSVYLLDRLKYNQIRFLSFYLYFLLIFLNKNKNHLYIYL